jgi:hypothetical protein
VQIEAGQARVPRHHRQHPRRVGIVPQTPHPGAPVRAERDPPCVGTLLMPASTGDSSTSGSLDPSASQGWSPRRRRCTGAATRLFGSH